MSMIFADCFCYDGSGCNCARASASTGEAVVQPPSEMMTLLIHFYQSQYRNFGVQKDSQTGQDLGRVVLRLQAALGGQ
jgi:hypothetical protein